MQETPMNDEAMSGERGHDGDRGGSDETPAVPPTRRKRHWGVLLFGIFVILPVLAIALWTTVALNWSYSKGTRAGYVQKFSQKGWLCKTWEGEIAMVNLPGAMQERFGFSVRDDSVAHEILGLMGSRVVITYEQHPGVPLRCFGDTEYYVTGVQAKP
ncbi:MAG: hypothetical protein ACRD3J_13270 [Thermoanaerobaculia bacterium]